MFRENIKGMLGIGVFLFLGIVISIFLFIDLEPQKNKGSKPKNSNRNEHIDFTKKPDDSRKTKENNNSQYQLQISIISRSSSTPIQGATIEVIPLGNQEKEIGLSDQSGASVFQELDRGEYRLEVNKNGYYSKSVNIKVDGRKKKRIFLTPIESYQQKSLTIRGSVKEESTGTPVEGAEVYLMAYSGGRKRTKNSGGGIRNVHHASVRKQIASTGTGRKGEFILDVYRKQLEEVGNDKQPSSFSFFICADKYGLAPSSQKVNVNKEKVVKKLTLNKGGRILVKAETSGGNPLKNVNVRANRVQEGEHLFDQYEVSAEALGPGRYEVIGLPEGTYKITLSGDRFGDGEIYLDQTVTVSTGETTRVTYQDVERGELKGTVTVHQKEVPSASIQIDGRRVGEANGRYQRKIKTDKSGNFKLTGVPVNYHFHININWKLGKIWGNTEIRNMKYSSVANKGLHLLDGQGQIRMKLADVDQSNSDSVYANVKIKKEESSLMHNLYSPVDKGGVARIRGIHVSELKRNRNTFRKDVRLVFRPGKNKIFSIKNESLATKNINLTVKSQRYTNNQALFRLKAQESAPRSILYGDIRFGKEEHKEGTTTVMLKDLKGNNVIYTRPEPGETSFVMGFLREGQYRLHIRNSFTNNNATERIYIPSGKTVKRKFKMK